MINRHSQSRGFTVVELIVAMSISAVTLLSGYELLQALKTAGDDQSATLAATASVVRGLDRIRDDLLHALPRTDSQESIFTGANPDLENMEEMAQVLVFYSLCPNGGNNNFRSLRRICQVSYELVKTEDAIGLYRNAHPVVGDRQQSSTESRGLILDHVDQITLAFHDGRRSTPSFSSDEYLPVGVEITVKTYERAWPLSVRLPCGNSEKGT